MNYTFHIKTKDATLIEEVETALDLTDAPFLVQGFRSLCSSTYTESELDQFWGIVNTIIADNNLQIDFAKYPGSQNEKVDLPGMLTSI
jgi:hypothetical protein